MLPPVGGTDAAALRSMNVVTQTASSVHFRMPLSMSRFIPETVQPRGRAPIELTEPVSDVVRSQVLEARAGKG
jgi:hypothetical protein